MSMAILALGISHRHASIELLERLSFADEDLSKGYRRALDEPALDGVVVLSTCNRVEVYGEVPNYHAGFQALKRLLCESRGVAPDELAEPMYAHYETEAAEHIFTVASGLDSMVLGEPQILSQVREALHRSEAEGAAGRQVADLFRAAARAGRRVRSETGVGRAPDAFVAVGADLAVDALGGLEGSTAVVIGAGQMAALAVHHLRDRGVGTVRILNRSLERARVLAERARAEPGDLEQIPAALADADLLVSATGAVGLVVTEPMLRRARAGREDPLFVLDLAVPRDVEPSVGALPTVTLVDLDGLRDGVGTRDARQAEAIDQARRIVHEEVQRFVVRARSQRLAPLIRALHERGDAAVRAELERFRSDLAGLEPSERETVEALARGVVAKLLHEPIVRLKELSGPGMHDVHARTVAELFGLEPLTDA